MKVKYLSMVALCCFLSACPNKEKSTDSPKEIEQDFAEIKIKDDSTQLLFTYLLADGNFKTVEKIADVPEKARSQVIVFDTSLSPEERGSSQLVYVADLTDKLPDGSYRYSLVSRFEFERNLLREPGSHSSVLPEKCQDLEPSPKDRILLYSAEWCGVCKATADFLQKEGIPFEKRDIEKNPKAQQELSCKALKSGQRINGIPVLDIGGALMLGLDRDKIVELARKLKKKPATTQR
jgi:glutaredoxin